MKIVWEINKERGNYRPNLKYSVLFEEWEKCLRIPIDRVQSSIPEPKSHYPIQMLESIEDDESKKVCELSIGGETITLPFRQSGEYPEVAVSMAILRDEIERRIIQAHDALALDITGELEMTPATKKHVAAYAAAWKMTQAGKEY